MSYICIHLFIRMRIRICSAYVHAMRIRICSAYVHAMGIRICSAYVRAYTYMSYICIRLVIHMRIHICSAYARAYTRYICLIFVFISLYVCIYVYVVHTCMPVRCIYVVYLHSCSDPKLWILSLQIPLLLFFGLLLKLRCSESTTTSLILEKSTLFLLM
jgi:hypothetical protein